METRSTLVKAIHFKDGKYLLINHERTVEYDKSVKDAYSKAGEALESWQSKIELDSIWFLRKKVETNLYGGRVNIYPVQGTWGVTNDVRLYVDGIPIITLGFHFDLTAIMSIELLNGHLNSIATNGVDAFLANYKKTLENHIPQIEKLIEKLTSMDSFEPNDEKEKARKLIIKQIDDLKDLLNLLLVLGIHLPLGFENDIAVELSNTIINMFK